jgi:FKBP-type peptidyl-prolyl cis-trans isomerase
MDKKYLFVTIFLITLVAIGAYFIFKIPSQNQEISDNINASDSGKTLGVETSKNMEDKLIIQDEVVGTGAEAVSGKKITVNYTGTLTNGTKFDSSLNPGRTPFTFNLGAGEVIAGWDQGFSGMKVGGKRKLTIPSSLGYGSSDMGVIPPNSVLIFDVELLDVE